MSEIELPRLFPDWPAPTHVHAFTTTRLGGVSAEPYASLNLGTHVGDDPRAVAQNQARLETLLPMAPLWLTQVHGTTVVNAASTCPYAEADAAFSHISHRVCAIMTADCLPVLFCNKQGSAIGAAHAGWRGLEAGVLEATFRAMQIEPQDTLVWLGPAIGPQAFEVGNDVYTAFIARDPAAAAAFVAQPQPGKWLANLYLLARQRLQTLGIEAIYGGEECTYSDSARFFSYRRDGITGRMASLIWLT